MQAIQDFKIWYAENWRGSRVGSWPLFFIVLTWFLIWIGCVGFALIRICRLLAG